MDLVAGVGKTHAVRLRRLVVGVVVGVVAAVTLGACSSSQPPPSGQRTSSRPDLPAPEFDAGLIHVHGLGIDPADGAVYAATHTGLFRIPTAGTAVRVANRAQDTMGFSVVGPRTFLGSGHPDSREDDVRPPLLGLIESRDAGQTWARLSLHGKADFHTLRSAHGQVYGYDSTSQTLMVTRDRSSWSRRATVPLRDFVVSPASESVIVATSQRGLTRSTDGGRTFTPMGGPAQMLLLDWSSSPSLFGLTAEGAVHHSSDGGLTWEHRGDVGGEPEAMAVDGRPGTGDLYVAVVGRGLLRSGDGGRHFSVRFRTP